MVMLVPSVRRYVVLIASMTRPPLIFICIMGWWLYMVCSGSAVSGKLVTEIEVNIDRSQNEDDGFNTNNHGYR
jgi:hypothetical protein